MVWESWLNGGGLGWEGPSEVVRPLILKMKKLMSADRPEQGYIVCWCRAGIGLKHLCFWVRAIPITPLSGLLGMYRSSELLFLNMFPMWEPCSQRTYNLEDNYFYVASW